MDMKPVDSSAIKAIGYDSAARKMHVLFKNGGLYEVPNTTPEQHKSLVGAKSIGAHYNKHHVKAGKKVTR